MPREPAEGVTERGIRVTVQLDVAIFARNVEHAEGIMDQWLDSAGPLVEFIGSCMGGRATANMSQYDDEAEKFEVHCSNCDATSWCDEPHECALIPPDARRIPPEVAESLDCIDRGEDEVGMHRKIVDRWRKSR
jgi:hypothetical protein